MEGVKLGRNSGSSSGCNSSSSMSSQSEEEMMMNNMELRRGPWTVEEDLTLINYIANHGEGRWNSLARCAGLKRTGKSCRLRWLNYLRPDVRRGNITLEEQLLILELHSRWGNRWSKIAQQLPGRTDNEIKNYWRTRVQKHAKQLKCDVNSKQFKDTMRYLWMPRLLERINASTTTTTTTTTTVGPTSSTTVPPVNNNNFNNLGMGMGMGNYNTPENSSTPASSDSFGPQLSDGVHYYNNNYNSATATVPVPAAVTPNYNYNTSFQASHHHQITANNYRSDHSTLTSAYYNSDVNVDNNNQGFGNIINQPAAAGLVDFQGVMNDNWNMDALDHSDMALWNTVDDIWFLPQHLNNNI